MVTVPYGVDIEIVFLPVNHRHHLTDSHSFHQNFQNSHERGSGSHHPRMKQDTSKICGLIHIFPAITDLLFIYTALML